MEKTCLNCRGQGQVQGSGFSIEECSTCDGKGVVYIKTPEIPEEVKNETEEPDFSDKMNLRGFMEKLLDFKK